ncbi:helix-turn-helix domain-containing protein (plasmid) [Bacillus mycoides]|nr:helix-turn-helix domain-containing protein [Bacillus mycoides]
MEKDGVQQGEVYVKMFVGVNRGLMAHLGANLWQLYSALATFMDRDGSCYPSQIQLAKVMGVSRETVNRRMQKLLKMEWKGEPIVTAHKVRTETNQFDNTIYTLNTDLAFRIF